MNAFDTDNAEAKRQSVLSLRHLISIDGKWTMKTRRGMQAACRFSTERDAQTYVAALHAYYDALNNPSRLIIYKL